ncbi:hypothetical protein GPJ56_009079 [Histomonas meleagridis]|uniref:uncharacterized protein n=1 Tax=Histomonas meleagridis TaxID=135588 RepID=UPI00355A6D25|nr:hypothetical protein GPJ56_009079 [Histomonas meleagridis]KAH0799264.1 hypothetical protein GO595_008061 [Histomonas meleagridis]
MDNFQPYIETAKQFVAKIPTTSHGWIGVMHTIPKLPYVFYLERLKTCFFIRESFPIKRPIYSLLLYVIIEMMHICIFSAIRQVQQNFIENLSIFPVLLLSWVLLNLTPFDLVYKIMRKLSFFICISNGFIDAYLLANAIDVAQKHFTDLTVVIVISVFFITAKHILVAIISDLTNKGSILIGPKLTRNVIGALIYCGLTEYSTSIPFNFDKDLVRLYMVIGFMVFELLGFIVKDEEWKIIGKFFAIFIRNQGNNEKVQPQEEEEQKEPENDQKEEVKKDEKQHEEREEPQNPYEFQKHNNLKRKNLQKRK